MNFKSHKIRYSQSTVHFRHVSGNCVPAVKKVRQLSYCAFQRKLSTDNIIGYDKNVYHIINKAARRWTKDSVYSNK